MSERKTSRIQTFAANLGAELTPEQKIKDYEADVETINNLEPQYEALTDEELLAKTGELKDKVKTLLGDTTKLDEESLKRAEKRALDEVLPEAFAAVREASKRTLGMRHFDVQIIGGAALHDGAIAEMKTGEGKTLVATLPLYLNALLGKGAHLVTVNDYLARRDARWMAPIFHMLGMSVGVLQSGATTENAKNAYLVDFDVHASQEEKNNLQVVGRKKAYDADITYGTNAEFGFDYLRDNMAMRPEVRVQRGHQFAIVDEVDNVLIDEARNPLIISGPVSGRQLLYPKLAAAVKELKPEDCEVDQRNKTASLTKEGFDHIEKVLGQKLMDSDKPEEITPEQEEITGILEQALRARFLFIKNRDYLVDKGKVVIIDEFTGRLMPGRRWSDGLHQAVEAKEGVKVEPESITYATITNQHYFRMYKRLAGMSGTALSEAEEFFKIYNLPVLPIPPNKESKRIDEPDTIFLTKEAKMRGVAIDIIKHHIKGQPVLAGTVNVEDSEELSSRLSQKNITTLLRAELIRHEWFKKQGRQDDGSIVKALLPLGDPLGKLASSSKLNKLMTKLELPYPLDHPKNIQRLVSILGLEANQQTISRLRKVLAEGVPHLVLNASKGGTEGPIIAYAGKFGAVTIATNMAGRGTDIKLGGEISSSTSSAVNLVLKQNGIEKPYKLSDSQKLSALKYIDQTQYGINIPEINLFKKSIEEAVLVRTLGGLRVIGSERHEARRIDNQLRGRAARQDDPGSTKFYVSLQDNLVVGGEKSARIIKERYKRDGSHEITHPLASKIVEDSQKRKEGANYDVRKHLFEYDSVLNVQRSAVYGMRDKVLEHGDITPDVEKMITNIVRTRVSEALAEKRLTDLTIWLDALVPGYEIFGRAFPTFNESVLLDDILMQSGADLQKSFSYLAMRTLKTTPSNQYEYLDPKDGKKKILPGIEGILDDIRVDIDREIAHLEKTSETYPKLKLLRRMAYGTVEVMTQRPRKRVPLVFKRLNYAYPTAQILESQNPTPEKLSQEVNTYLTRALEFQAQAWGERELKSNSHTPIPNVPETKEALGHYIMQMAQRQMLLGIISELWVDHLTNLESRRVSVGTEAYARLDPLTVYKSEASKLFNLLMDRITNTFVAKVFVPFPESAPQARFGAHFGGFKDQPVFKPVFN